jgi:hypothetical protein
MEPGNQKGTAPSTELDTNEITSMSTSIPNKQNTKCKQNMYISSPITDKAEQLNLLVINFQSIRNKKEELELMLIEQNIDIVLGSETHLSTDISDNELLHPSYTCYRRDREDGYGGVIIITKKRFAVEKIVTSKTCEFLAVKIQTRKQPIIIATAYRPPRSTIVEAENIKKELIMLHSKFKANPIWFGGDLNLPDIDWSTNSITKHQYPKEINECFLDTFSTCNLEQIVDFPTRGPNTLDIMTTNRPNLVTNCSPNMGLSDHDTSIYLEIDCHAKKTKPVKRQIFLWNQADINILQQHVAAEVANFMTNNSLETHIDNMWGSFRKLVETSMKFVPSKLSSTRFSQPWVTKSCKRLSRRKKRAYNRARRTTLQSDWDKFKALTKETRTTCKQAFNKYVRDCICPDINKNRKRFFSFIKSKKCDNIGVSPLRDKSGKVHVDDKTKAILLNQQFVSVFSNDDGKCPNMTSPRSPTMPEITVTVNGVKQLLTNIDPYKASGADMVPARFLKEFATEIAPALTLIFNASLRQGIVPSEWKEAIINPTYKPGKNDRGNAENYRPISLTSISCKILEHIIHSNVIKHLEYKSILTDTQHGFRKRRSCVTQLVLVANDFAKSLNRSKQLDTILLDFSKAFDKVNHRKLLLKMDHYGIRGQVLDWVSNFLNGRTQRVVINGESSPNANITSGVPQGTVLGPLLFLIYINDIPDRVKSHLRLFADDSYLYRIINSQQDTIQLQKDLDELIKWENEWSMEFHPDKCKLLRVTNKMNPIHSDYHMHSQKLSTVDTAKYLGVVLHKKLSWKPHVDAMCKKADKTRGFLQRNLRGCPQDVKSQCYKTYVRPILEYASVVWDPAGEGNQHLRYQVEMVQRRAARSVTGDWRTTSSVSEMIKTLGWETLENRRLQSRLSFLHSYCHKTIDIPETIATRARGVNINYQIINPVLRCYNNSFVPTTVRQWNSLPPHIRNEVDATKFKSKLNNINL